MILSEWEIQFQTHIASIASVEDPAHDLAHFKRVVHLAKTICEKEKADPWVVVPAAWLHDVVIVPKNSPLRKQASRLSAEKAIEFLCQIQFPSLYYEAIAHAIEGHSFSANIEVKTLEAKIVQDADRLDGLGAIGIARCFATAGLLKRAFYSDEDPFCERRTPDDSQFTLDHFYQKLFKTAETLRTEAGRAEGKKRVQVMKTYLNFLKEEVGNES
jgi:uncharacterized protein